MDSMFSFAFVQALLARIPPPLAERVERICQEKGFDTLLAAYLASSDALTPFLQSLRAAVLLVEVSPAAIEVAKRRIADGLSLGMLDHESWKMAATYGSKTKLP